MNANQFSLEYASRPKWVGSFCFYNYITIQIIVCKKQFTGHKYYGEKKNSIFFIYIPGFGLVWILFLVVTRLTKVWFSDIFSTST